MENLQNLFTIDTFTIINAVTNLGVLIFLLIYIFRLKSKEDKINKKENSIDTDYHRIVDDALLKERKILDDSSLEATQIITEAKYTSQSTKERIDQAIDQMVTGVQEQTHQTSQEYLIYYQSSLKQIVQQSLFDFQAVFDTLKTDASKQSHEFKNSLLSKIEEEAQKYKEIRIQEVESQIKTIVQKVSQEVLNRSLDSADHEKIIIQALEKAKTEEVFE